MATGAEEFRLRFGEATLETRNEEYERMEMTYEEMSQRRVEQLRPASKKGKKGKKGGKGGKEKGGKKGSKTGSAGKKSRGGKRRKARKRRKEVSDNYYSLYSTPYDHQLLDLAEYSHSDLHHFPPIRTIFVLGFIFFLNLLSCNPPRGRKVTRLGESPLSFNHSSLPLSPALSLTPPSSAEDEDSVYSAKYQKIVVGVSFSTFLNHVIVIDFRNLRDVVVHTPVPVPLPVLYEKIPYSYRLKLTLSVMFIVSFIRLWLRPIEPLRT